MGQPVRDALVAEESHSRPSVRLDLQRGPLALPIVAEAYGALVRSTVRIVAEMNSQIGSFNEYQGAAA